MRKRLIILVLFLACLLPITVVAAGLEDNATIEVKEDLDGSWNETRLDNTNFGNLITDGYRTATDADVAIESADYITGSLSKGTVSGKELKDCLKDPGEFKEVTLTGSEIWVIIERSLGIMMENRSNQDLDVTKWGSKAGLCLQFSGAEIYYDDTKDIGSRISMITINGETINDNQEYKIVYVDGHMDLEYYPELAEGVSRNIETNSVDAVYKQMQEASWSDINDERFLATEDNQLEAPRVSFMTSVLAGFGVILVGVLIGWLIGRKRYKEQ